MIQNYLIKRITYIIEQNNEVLHIPNTNSADGIYPERVNEKVCNHEGNFRVTGILVYVLFCLSTISKPYGRSRLVERKFVCLFNFKHNLFNQEQLYLNV